MSRYEEIDPRELLEDGTIWLVNLAVLWPRGLALAVEETEDGAVLKMLDYGEYMAGFVAGLKEDLLIKRTLAFRDAEERREAKAVGRDRG